MVTSEADDTERENIPLVSSEGSDLGRCRVLHARFSAPYSESGKIDDSWKRAWSEAIGKFCRQSWAAISSRSLMITRGSWPGLTV